MKIKTLLYVGAVCILSYQAVEGFVKYTHNVPYKGSIDLEIKDNLENTVNVFCDSNGDFFTNTFMPKRKLNEYFFGYGWTIRYQSEINHVEELAQYNAQKVRSTIIKELNGFLAPEKGFEHVFILVHGFNSLYKDSLKAYGEARSTIQELKLNPDKVAYIYFHWNGLGTQGEGRQLTFWNNSCGYSQMAGICALRPILNTIPPDIKVHIISHSRGASVVFSALSNPPFVKSFITSTLMKDDPIDIPRLANSGNYFKQVERPVTYFAVVPAIGQCDLLKPNYTASGKIIKRDETPKKYSRFNSYRSEPHCPFDQIYDTNGTLGQFRKFPSLVRCVIGFNINDSATSKKVKRFADNFGDTSIGCNYQDAATQVGEAYDSIRAKNLMEKESSEHNFIAYIKAPTFIRTLKEVVFGEQAKDRKTHQESSSIEEALNEEQLKQVKQVGLLPQAQEVRQAQQTGNAKQAQQTGQATQVQQTGQATQVQQTGQATQVQQTGQATQVQQIGQASQAQQKGRRN
jgi:hypothetical protein